MASSWRHYLLDQRRVSTDVERNGKQRKGAENEENRRENRGGHCPLRLPNISNKFLSSLNAWNFMEVVTRPYRRIYRPIRSAAINAAMVPATVPATVSGEDMRTLYFVALFAIFCTSVFSLQQIFFACDYNFMWRFIISTIVRNKYFTDN